MSNYTHYTRYIPGFVTGALALAIGVSLYLKSTRPVEAQDHYTRSRHSAISIQDPLCRGPPNIQHLFDAYDGLARIVGEGPVFTPSIDRLREWGDRERQAAADLYDNCRTSLDPGLTRLLADLHAITAINAVTEAKLQQMDMTMPMPGF